MDRHCAHHILLWSLGHANYQNFLLGYQVKQHCIANFRGKKGCLGNNLLPENLLFAWCQPMLFRSKTYFEGVKYKMVSKGQSVITNLIHATKGAPSKLHFCNLFVCNNAYFNLTFVALLTMSRPVARA